MKEIWRDIKGYKKFYQVSNLGRVKSLGGRNGCKKRPIIMKCNNDKKERYHRVLFSKKGSVRRFMVHRLVAEAFIPNLKNKPIVNHKDGNKRNNRVDNLEWATLSEDSLHAFKLGLQKPKKGEESHFATVNRFQVQRIKLMWEIGGITQREIAKIFNVGKGCVESILQGKTWKHIT